jgi:hypothetical protein
MGLGHEKPNAYSLSINNKKDFVSYGAGQFDFDPDELRYYFFVV